MVTWLLIICGLCAPRGPAAGASREPPPPPIVVLHPFVTSELTAGGVPLPALGPTLADSLRASNYGWVGGGIGGTAGLLLGAVAVVETHRWSEDDPTVFADALILLGFTTVFGVVGLLVGGAIPRH
jgi:hypothetical protein